RIAPRTPRRQERQGKRRRNEWSVFLAFLATWRSWRQRIPLTTRKDLSMISRRTMITGGAASLATGAMIANDLLAQAHKHDANATSSDPAAARTIPPDSPPLRPGEPGRDYTPCVVPNVPTLPWKVVDGVKVFHLIANTFRHEIAPGLVVNAWGYNGVT